jgi:competence protein ComEC
VESFHRVGWISLPLNVLGAVVAALVTPLGLTLTVLPGPLASPVAGVVDLMLALLDLAVRIALEIPGGTVRVPSAPPVLWLMFALGAGLLGLGLRLRRAGASALGLACALGSGLAMVRADFSPPPPRHPVLTFLDVGQGDSTLVEMPGGQTLVVDGGGVRSGALTESGGFRVGEDVVSSYLFSRRFRRLDVLVLSHAHHDHLDGLFDLIRNFRVGEVWLGPNPMTPRYREFLDLIYTRGIPIRHVRAGDTLGRFTVLHPPRAQIVGNEVRNDDSVVLGLRWAGRRALLTGDLESDLEVPDWTEVALLKVPHHGSADTALGVRAGVPVISVGRTNAFGHPAASRLPALRTDLLGAIRVDLGPRGPRVGFPGLTDGPGGSD